MPYRFVTERQDYTDFSGGRVFYAHPGMPAFPVRLVSEIFQRCLALREKAGLSKPCLLYDPCCGGATHLAALAFLHRESIAGILASDIDPKALSFAKKNLSLATLEGMDRRIGELEHMQAEFGKESHAAALESARRLRSQFGNQKTFFSFPIHLFQADATDPESVQAAMGSRRADVLLADVPYGRLSDWQSRVTQEGNPASPVSQMLQVMLDILGPGAVVAIASDKSQKVTHPGYRQVGKLRQGKRQVVFLTILDSIIR
jgi:23S rRNA G2445 N2-methylase RlmL